MVGRYRTHTLTHSLTISPAMASNANLLIHPIRERMNPDYRNQGRIDLIKTNLTDNNCCQLERQLEGTV